MRWKEREGGDSAEEGVEKGNEEEDKEKRRNMRSTKTIIEDDRKRGKRNNKVRSGTQIITRLQYNRG